MAQNELGLWYEMCGVYKSHIFDAHNSGKKYSNNRSNAKNKLEKSHCCDRMACVLECHMPCHYTSHSNANS